MKRLIFKLLVALLTFIFSLVVTWLTAWFADEPVGNEKKAINHIQEIHDAQDKRQPAKFGGVYTELEPSGRDGLVDRELASGGKDGCSFTLKPFPKFFVNDYRLNPSTCNLDEMTACQPCV